MRPMVWVAASPMCCQVLPASVDLKTPTPATDARKMLASPVPTQMISEFEGAIARSPIEIGAI